MTGEEMITDAGTYFGTCRGCGHDLVPSTQGQPEDIPENEILLECGILDTNECVAGESFLISELIN